MRTERSWELARGSSELEGMGTTLCAAGLTDDGDLTVVNVGDSRVHVAPTSLCDECVEERTLGRRDVRNVDDPALSHPGERGRPSVLHEPRLLAPPCAAKDPRLARDVEASPSEMIRRISNTPAARRVVEVVVVDAEAQLTEVAPPCEASACVCRFP